MQHLFNHKEYKELVAKIGVSFLDARQNAVKAINTELTLSNWNVGKYIVEYEQKEDVFVEYATASITNKLAIGEYQLYLPEKKELQNKVKDILNKEQS